MKTASTIATTALLLLAGLGWGNASAQTVVDSDFSKGNFAAQGWEAKGPWDVFTYPTDAAKELGAVARFGANKPDDGTLVKKFDEVRNPSLLTLSIDYGWGWGDATQPADGIGFMLLDAKNNGYVFEVHRCKANWAVQWAPVTAGKSPDQKHWAPVEIDASQLSVRDGGKLSRLTITRDPDGAWSMTDKGWNQGAGATLAFSDASTGAFSQIVLLGTKNFDEQVFNKIQLTVGTKETVTKAQPVSEFLDSVGICSTFPDRGQPLDKTVEMVKYCGFRWVRGGIEGLSTNGPTTLETYLELHRKTGVKFNWGLVSGGTDVKKLIETARTLAEADALIAFEGNNEPNNWGVTYQGEQGGGKAPSWVAVAKLQRDLYQAVKSDPLLKKYPVWSISENGAELDNVGLQFLMIPPGAGTVLPEGTKFADAANVHNYIYHPGSPGLMDNKSWNAADPTSACKVDGLFGNYGLTWAKHYRGYSESELKTLPKVTTETGCTIDGPVTEEIQGLNLLSMYLDQFKRGWSHTSVYILRDRTDEGGNQSFGFFDRDYKPRKAAVYLHNLTTILADKGTAAKSGELKYSLSEQPATVHEMLLQKSDGSYALVVWGERLKGSDDVTVRLDGKHDVKIYDPTKGTDPVQTPGSTEVVKLTLSNHPFVLMIAP